MPDEARTVYVVAEISLHEIQVGVLGVFSAEEKAQQYLHERRFGPSPRVALCSCGLDAEEDAPFGDAIEYQVLIDLQQGTVRRRDAAHFWCHLRSTRPDDRVVVYDPAPPARSEHPGYVLAYSWVSEEQAFQLAVKTRKAWFEEHDVRDSAPPLCLDDEPPCEHYWRYPRDDSHLSQGTSILGIYVGRLQEATREGHQTMYVVTEISDEDDWTVIPDGVFSSQDKAEQYVRNCRRGRIIACVVDAEENARFGERVEYRMWVRLDNGRPCNRASHAMVFDLRIPAPDDWAIVLEHDSPPCAYACTSTTAERAFDLASRAREDWLKKHPAPVPLPPGRSPKRGWFG